MANNAAGALTAAPFPGAVVDTALAAALDVELAELLSVEVDAAAELELELELESLEEEVVVLIVLSDVLDDMLVVLDEPVVEDPELVEDPLVEDEDMVPVDDAADGEAVFVAPLTWKLLVKLI